MLRTTSEAMSGILGGSNTISNVPYDAIYHKSNEFGERIARNQLLILQQESYLQEAQKFADGAYYIEAITQQLAENALTLFKQIEKAGGHLKKGAKSEIVFYWLWTYYYANGKITKNENEAVKKIPNLRYYRVFNAPDIEGIE